MWWLHKAWDPILSITIFVLSREERIIPNPDFGVDLHTHNNTGQTQKLRYHTSTRLRPKKENSIRTEIEKCIGTHTIKVVIVEDHQTLNIMYVNGLVPFICTLG